MRLIPPNDGNDVVTSEQYAAFDEIDNPKEEFINKMGSIALKFTENFYVNDNKIQDRFGAAGISIGQEQESTVNPLPKLPLATTCGNEIDHEYTDVKIDTTYPRDQEIPAISNIDLGGFVSRFAPRN